MPRFLPPATATAATLEAAITELLPAFVVSAVAPCGEESSPHEDELLAVARAVASRRREFLSGRACAHRALAAAGLDAGPIGVGPRREPLWPAGAVGSIAHTGGWSAAIVARAGDAWGLGFDLELLEPSLADDVDRLVRTAAERDQAPTGHPLDAHANKLLFSIKEAVYKCLFPRTRWPLEFGDVQVATDLDAGRYTAVVDKRFEPTTLGLGLVEGRFRVVGALVLAALCIPADYSRPAPG